jgi:hypothetical protein
LFPAGSVIYNRMDTLLRRIAAHRIIAAAGQREDVV